MGVISFSDSAEGTWHAAGWAFRQILDDVLSQNPGDDEMAEEFELAKILSGLILYLLEPPVAHRVEKAISEVANGIVVGTVRSGIGEQPYGDEVTVKQYLGSLEELVRTLRRSRQGN
jgi:hypothetical protein